MPCRHTQNFSTADDFQDRVPLRLFRGSGVVAEDVRKLGAFAVIGFLREPRGTPRIAITFAVQDGRVALEAVDSKTGKPLQIVRTGN